MNESLTPVKPKQRKRLLEQKARKEAARLSTECIQTSDSCIQIGNVCTHYEYDNYSTFLCSRCKACYDCSHDLIEREEAGSILWWRCPDGFEKPSYLDRGQFSSLRRITSSEGTKWQNC